MTDRCDVLTLPVEPVSPAAAAATVAGWAAEARGRVVCAANVHMVMEAWDDPGFARALAGADLVVCDGRPLVWYCRAAGLHAARQARGLDVMLAACATAEKDGTRVGLYGGTSEALHLVRRRLVEAYPGLDIVYSYSPPFRELTPPEDDAVTAAIAAAGVGILFVALGCPKQERWMLAHRERLAAVMLGIGAAVDFVAGNVPSAPRWMQVAGLEWAFRLAHEPRRLWRRYARSNARFVVLAARTLSTTRARR
jgi:N-acetylglucosaminyldiphosphoundecaprenol N-acetyl-beta-D-mannosaminyltransferase